MKLVDIDLITSMAICSGNIGIVSRFIHYTTNNHEIHPIEIACQSNQPEVLDYLLQIYPTPFDLNTTQTKVFALACERNELDIVRVLSKRCEIDSQELREGFLLGVKHQPIMEYFLNYYNPFPKFMEDTLRMTIPRFSSMYSYPCPTKLKMYKQQFKLELLALNRLSCENRNESIGKFPYDIIQILKSYLISIAT